MRHSFGFLLNDRPLIEFGRDVMRGCADQFHTPLMRLVVGFRALEAWEKGMVDVDHASKQTLRKIVRQNLHVPRQNDEVSLCVFNDPQELFLLLHLVVLCTGR